ncbi:conserved Plasmodium protein, unknown function [Plasmodium yoelii]|nr:conserved Plasmodium protein, unknown function [Plasmodium yoelii]WBY59823.1 hypothetical protein Py17XNL_001303023 [Plasmodium yoelii yoelii]CDU19777.1 conserved Plasmodium protein, unknown function [Plasmodium yoelii]VTZ80534.1 conserved Plasmodium protein, unknown function [Plasmodium yoelii]|eukprot:XP_728740.2 conserved Plasmodium protein, unknown function [Plasmodium yoelii]
MEISKISKISKNSKIDNLSNMANNPKSTNDKKTNIENEYNIIDQKKEKEEITNLNKLKYKGYEKELNKNYKDYLNEDNFIEQFCQNLNNEFEENIKETELLSDIDDNFIFKKKIYEKNIAQIEKQIQTNKLNRLIKTNEIMIEMLTLIKNRKLNTKSFF